VSGASLILLGHGAERTGPPVYLVRLLRWLEGRPDLDVRVVLLEDGPLLDQMRELAPVVVGDPDRPGPQLDRARAELAGWPRADVAVVNTAGSIRALPLLHERPTRLVSYVHELATGFDFHLSARDRQVLLTESDLIVAVSGAVADFLRDEHRVPAARLRVHRGVVEPPGDAPSRDDGRRLLHEVGVPDGSPVVVGSGTLDWRKGPDLFTEVAMGARRDQPDLDVRFVWVGGDLERDVAATVADRIAREGGSGVHLVGEQPDARAWFAGADVFLLPSREDAYPLVCLEAASQGLPIVCFDAGGIPEFVRDDAGIVVPFPDIDAAAKAVTALLTDEPRRQFMGATGARRAAEEANPDVVFPALLRDVLGTDA
jgi:glycosyltransferase involved in cell wall biosynthesis